MRSFTFKPLPENTVAGVMLDGYSRIPGLEGPFRLENGQICYYDPESGCFLDPKTQKFIFSTKTALTA
jgi:hypothetical protein